MSLFTHLRNTTAGAFTSFSLTDEQVDKLTDSARNLIRKEETFQKLLKDLGQP